MARGSIVSRTETIPANGIVKLGPANFIFILSVSSGSIEVDLDTIGVASGNPGTEKFSGIVGGLQLSRVKRWGTGTLTGTVGASVTFWYGYTDVREDNTIFSQQIAIIAGVTAVAISPAASVTDTVAVVTVTPAQTALFPANLARRRITVFSDPANVGAVIYFRKSGGVNNVAFVVPGMSVEFDGTYGIDYQTATANDKLYLFEES